MSVDAEMPESQPGAVAEEERTTKTSTFSVISEEEQDAYLSAQSAGNVEEATLSLAAAMNMGNYSRDVRQAARVDFAACCLNFGSESKLSFAKCSVVLGLGIKLFEMVVTGEETTKMMATVKDVLLPLLVPSEAHETFTTEQVKLTTDFLVSSLIRQKSLYQLVFEKEPASRERFLSVLVEQPRVCSLSEALDEEDWNAKCEAERLAKEREEEEVARAAAQQAMERAAAAARTEEEAEEARRQEELTRKPVSLEEMIDKLVLVKVEETRTALLEAHEKRAQELLAKIAELEGTGEEIGEPAES